MVDIFGMLLVVNNDIISLLNRAIKYTIIINRTCDIRYDTIPNTTDKAFLLLFLVCPIIIPLYPADTIVINSRKKIIITINLRGVIDVL